VFQFATGSGRVFEPAHVVSVSLIRPERRRSRILASAVERQGLEGC
jgi:hypothetical protein